MNEHGGEEDGGNDSGRIVSNSHNNNYGMPLNHQYVKICEMKVIGNIFDNPELLGGTK